MNDAANLLLVIGVLIGYYLWFVQIVLPFFKNNEAVHQIANPSKVTVVVCAKNEEQNLPKLMEELKKQDYPYFEVLLLDDNSEDNTYLKAKNAISDDARFTIRRINETEKKLPAKKGVVEIAYNLVNTDWILHIDADCIPASYKWISLMMSCASNKAVELILGVGLYGKTTSWWHHMVRAESELIAMQYVGTALHGNAYMGVGRNMAVHKNIYKQAEFDTESLSGDDDMIVQQFATKKNTIAQYLSGAHTWSTYPKSFWAYLKMKKRHFGTAAQYKWQHKMLLVLLPFSTLCLILGLFFWQSRFWGVFVVVFFLKELFLRKLSGKLNSRHVFGFLVFIESYLVIQSTLVYLVSIFIPTKKWN